MIEAGRIAPLQSVVTASDTFPLRVGPRKTVLARTYRILPSAPYLTTLRLIHGREFTPIDDYLGCFDLKSDSQLSPVTGVQANVIPVTSASN